jgi:tripartite-type tricarboxylate transporter receptor subunit TctC
LAVVLPLHQAKAAFPEKPITIVVPWPAKTWGNPLS